MYLYEIALFLVNLAAAILWGLGKGKTSPNYPSIPFCIMIASFMAIIMSVAINGSMLQRCPPAGSGFHKILPGVYCEF